MLNVASVVFLVLGIAFAAEVAGSLAGPLGLFLGLAFLALGVLVGRSEGRGRFRVVLLILSAAVIVCGLGLLALWPHGRVNRLFAIAVLLAGTDVAFRAFGQRRRELYPSAAISLLAAIFFLLLKYSPPAWMFWQNASITVSRLVGAWVGKPLKLGPSYSGFHTTALLVISVLVVFAVTQRRQWYRLALALVYLVAVAFAYMLAMTFLKSFDEAAHLGEVAGWSGESAARHLLPILARHVPWNMPLVLLVAQLPALWLVGDRVKLRAGGVLPVTLRDMLWTGAVVVGLLGGVAALVVRRPERPVMSARVVLYEKGYLNWSSPDFESFGEYSAGMLGRLPVFLKLLGFDVVRSKSLDDEALADARVVVIFNPYEKLSDAEHASVWDFVRRGGSLLVVGEHTWLNDRDEDTLNHLLSPSDIRFQFDSARYQIGGWLHGYGFSADAVYYRMRGDGNHPGIGIGASLRLKGSAEPMLFGTHGYSDWGVRPRRPQTQFLGDNRYVPGEQLGDLVLLAQQPFGAGRVVAVGDTSGFFNLLMMGSHDAVARLFAKLAAPPVRRYHAVRLVVALVFLAAAVALWAASPRWFVLSVLLVGLLAGVGVPFCASREAASIQPVPKGDVAYVDSSHVGKFSREIWRDDGLAGLYLNLMRNDVQSLRMDAFSAERLFAARMLFINAPSRRYSEREAGVISQFIKRGGYVVVCAGEDSAAAVEPLLLRFGLRVRNKPLGPRMSDLLPTSAMVRFHVGYVVENVSGDNAGVLVWYDRPGEAAMMIERLEPEVSSTSARRGGLLLIGDGHFFTNKNLEPEKRPPIMENVNFVRWLIGHVRGLESRGSGS